MLDKSGLLILITVIYISGLAAFFTGLDVWIAVGVLILLSALVVKNIVSGKAAILAFIVFILAFLNCHLRIKDFDELALITPQNNAIITGTISSNLTTNDPIKTKFYFDVENIKLENSTEQSLKAKTIVSISDENAHFKKLEIGDRASIKGNLYLPARATNPSQFNYAKYLRNKHVYTTFYGKDDCFEKISSPQNLRWKFLQKLNLIKLKILNIHTKYIKSPNIEVIGGIIFGDDAVNPPDEIKTSFVNSGLFHILSASGMNVALIFGLCFFILQKLRVSYRLSIGAGMLVVLVYTCMTGFPPSILRASLAMEFVLLGKLIDRQSNTLALLFFVALLMLLYNPATINDLGFKLSFIVTFGLILMCGPICDLLNKKLPPIVSDTICIPFIAQLWIIPIQMYYFNTFATYSLFANIAMMPVFTITSFGGFASFSVALIPVVGDKLVFLISYITNLSASALIWVSDFFSNMPHSLVATFKPTLFQIFVYYSSLFGWFYCFVDRGKNKKVLYTAVFATLLLIISLVPIKRDDCEVIFFDVGNADMALIKSPKNQYFMVDTGKIPFNSTNSQAKTIAGKYLKDRGIKKINTVVLTHYDSDHAGGFVHFAEDFKIGNIILNRYNHDSGLYKEIFETINLKKLNFTIAKNNQKIFSEKDFEIRVFQAEKSEKISDNETSIITLLSYKDKNLLFMGDAGVLAYSEIKNILPKNVEIIKIGHHGAKDTIDEKMIKNLNLDTAVLSVGQNNYRHPHFSTVISLKQNNIPTYRTDTLGAIKTLFKKQQKEPEYLYFNLDTEKFVPITR